MRKWILGVSAIAIVATAGLAQRGERLSKDCRREVVKLCGMAGPNAPSFLILHDDREDGKRQSEALEKALRKAGTKTQLNAFEGKGMKGHAEINRKLGDPAYPATPVVDAWLKGVFAR